MCRTKRKDYPYSHPENHREGRFETGSLRSRDAVFYGGCNLSKDCHAIGEMDRKKTNFYSFAKVDRITQALPLARTFCRASSYSGTGQAGGSLSG